MTAAAQRHLLFGLLALQNGMINQGQLVAAFQAWTLDKSRSLADHLEARGDLTGARRALLEGLAEVHLETHGGDVEKSLGSISTARDTRERLAAIGDPEIEATLAHVQGAVYASDRGDAELTATYSVGSATSEGSRFRILRPHARGGLGAVFVALDGELNREVALKQILDSHADDLASRQRFMIEAEITGGLEHPGVVPVYGLGTFRDGRPYYAMRFIKGDSFREAIDRYHKGKSPSVDLGRRSLELHSLLRRFTDLCNAIDYAHSRGIVHRDIKPSNVILGKHGETLVVDWGLAKPLGRVDPKCDAGERTLVPSSASGSSETLPGSALGTPAYMSPEQARGDLDRIGPHSDIYALGATLFCLLTGRAPFVDEDVGEVVRKVGRGEVAEPRQLNPGIDQALEAICKKAMALEPKNRYTTCRALADDIERWMADEPVLARPEPWTKRTGRWMRRHRTLVTSSVSVLIFGLAGLAGFATVLAGKNGELDAKNIELAGKNRELDARNVELAGKNGELDAKNLELEKQRQLAERRETLAIDAVRKFRDAVESNPELKNRRELDGLRKALLKEPLAFFGKLRDDLQRDRDTQPGALARLADANYELARTTEEIGSAPDAIRSYSESVALHEQLGRAGPTAESCQYHLAASHNHLGVLFRATGRPAEAMESYRRSAAAFERMARDRPTVVQYEDDVAGCYLNMGNLLRAMGQPAGAIESYRKGLVVFERLEREHPANTQVRLDLAVSHMNIGNVQSDMGRRDEALASCRRALPIYERLVAENPGVHDYESGLAGDLDNIGSQLSAMGHHAEALESHRRALGMYERLARSHSSVTRFQNDLAICYMNIGNALNLIGQPAEALDSFRRGLEIHEQLVRDHPSVPGYRSGLGALLNNVAMFETRQGRWAEGRVLLERAVEQQRAAIKLLPRHPTFRRFLRNHLSNLVTVYRALNQPVEAARAAREWADLVRGDPADLYNVACALAHVLPVAHGEQRQALAAQAIRTLNEAVAAGWNDARRMIRDPNLAALHELDDFHRLLARMFDRGFPADPFVR